MSRLIIALYESFNAAHEAVKELLDKGSRQDSVSLVVHQAVCGRILRDQRSQSWFFQSQPSKVQLLGIGPILISGFLASELDVFSRTQRNSLVRLLENQMVPEVDANAYTEGVRRMGVLVVIKAERTSSSKIFFALERHCPVDIQELVDMWHKAGWTSFDDTSRPLAGERFSWPASITNLPGDMLLFDGVLKNWPQSIMNPSTR